jgi:uncharacterized RDD family membrane protein YckC
MHSIEDHINIETTQQIALEHSRASIGERILAAFIDYFIIFAILMMIALLSGISRHLAYVLVIPVFFYQLIMEWIFNGQSVGKKIMKIKVVMLDGGKCGFLNYFIRWTFRLIDINATLGAMGTLFIMLHPKGQRVGDIAAGTCVVRLAKNIGLDSLIVSVPKDHIPQFTQAMNLNDSDIQILQEVVDMWNQGVDFSNVDLYEANLIAGKARQAFEKKLGITSSLTDLNFLNSLLKDYYYYHQAKDSHVA